jgi:hypothetical protein
MANTLDELLVSPSRTDFGSLPHNVLISRFGRFYAVGESDGEWKVFSNYKNAWQWLKRRPHLVGKPLRLIDKSIVAGVYYDTVSYK